MAKQSVDLTRSLLYCSSSISNWRSKIEHKWYLPRWNPLGSLVFPTLFFGMYNVVDYVCLVFTRKRIVFWCGSDILALTRRPFWRWLLPRLKARHICENIDEKRVLAAMGIKAEIQPIFIGDVERYPVSYRPSAFTHAYLCAHPGRELEYGVMDVEAVAPHVPEVMFHIYGITGHSHHNVMYHGHVSEDTFDLDIQRYHAALRLNFFDGFGDVLAKSILLGQYPIAYIRYPGLSCARNKEDLVKLLHKLRTHKVPNPNTAYWRRLLNQPL